MFNFDYITNWQEIFDHTYRILIFGGSVSGNTFIV